MNELPKIYDIATRNVVKIDPQATIEECVKLMALENVRDVIVERSKNGQCAIITINDLIRLKALGVNFDEKLAKLPLRDALSINKDIDVGSAIDQAGDEFEYICVCDHDNSVIGIISQTDLLSNIDPKILMQIEKIGNLVLSQKIKTIDENVSTFEAILALSDHADDCVIALENGRAVGILTTKDAISLFAKNIDLSKPLCDHMSSPVETVSHRVTIKEAIDFMKGKHFKRVVVANDSEEIIGIVTQKDITRLIYNRWLESVQNSKIQLSRKHSKLIKKTKRLEEIASSDYLTGAFTRSKFDENLSLQLERVIRYKEEPFSIIFFDIDNFKKINDTFGHLVGDEVLKRLANIVRSVIRKNDLLARWGGEEFAILLPYTKTQIAFRVAEKIRMAIEGSYFEDVGTVTCSFGVSGFEGGGCKQCILESADKALYNAKEGGKNRVVYRGIEEVNENI